MPSERYFTNEKFQTGSIVNIEDREWHHLVHVMRGSIGQKIELVNGLGDLAQADIQSIQKKRAEVILTEVHSHPKPTFEIVLIQAIPRMNRLDTILEKATELGATQIWLFPGVLSERKKLTPDQLKRAHSVTVSALKQCGRLWLPTLELKPYIKNWEQPPFQTFFGDLSHEALPFLDVLKKTNPKNGIMIVIGPESGLSSDEISQLKSLKSTGVKLHQNILRADTASIVSLSLISHLKIIDNL